MTKKRMLAMVKSKTFTKFIEGTDLPKSVFPLLKNSRKGQSGNDQHSQLPVYHKQQNLRQKSFQTKSEKTQDQQVLLNHISKLLKMEIIYFLDCSFLFFVDPLIDDKVNAEMRDSTVKSLMNMNKVFYELPIDVFVKSVAIVDRFITKVKVKPKYITCVTVACFFIAAKTTEPGKINCPTLASLSQLSKCGGSVEDLERMTDIILTKLNYNLETVTAHDFLTVFYRLLRGNSNSNNNGIVDIEWRHLELLLELGQQSLRVCCQRPCVVALACMLALYSPAHQDLISSIRTVAVFCKVDLALISQTADRLIQLYRNYYSINNNNNITNIYNKKNTRLLPRKNNLVWMISKRTLSSIYGSSATSLATIDEHVEEEDNYDDEDDDDNECSYESMNWNSLDFEPDDWSSSFDTLFEYSMENFKNIEIKI